MNRSFQVVLRLSMWLPGLPAAVAFAQNAIVLENSLPGQPPSQWDVTGAGDPSIQGFATEMSVNRGEVVAFKVDTPATDYRIDVYRLGYYGGTGARRVASVEPSVALPQAQPACLHDPATGLNDCGNWAVSATWAVPPEATSGIHVAKLVREDPEDGRASHVVFIVRDDDGGSDLLFQTSDATWQAYNRWGGSSLYTGGPGVNPPRAYKVSYNRPLSVRGTEPWDSVFNGEYPMVRWLERNGYDVSYFTNVDTDRRGHELLEHRAFLSVGHDEYWSAGQREAVEAARNAGVHLAFLSADEVYWKTRWEPSTDPSVTPHRTLVCYKETLAQAKIDPLPDVWTGEWRDCNFSPPADGCRPEGRLSGQMGWTSNICGGVACGIEVPAAQAGARLWRNTPVAKLQLGQTYVLPPATLGYEWDFEHSRDLYPPGRITLSRTVVSSIVHEISLYRHPCGALVFGAGTVQWSWGLDDEHVDGPFPPAGGGAPDAAAQQLTVNLLAEYGVQPATLQAGLVPAAPTGDLAPPVSEITTPLDGASTPSGRVLIAGTAHDAGGTVSRVEVSVDGGESWRAATGAEYWSLFWDAPPAAGQVTVLARAVDDLANLETPRRGVTLSVDPPPVTRIHATVPNPGAPGAVVIYDVSRAAQVRLSVYSVAGRLVRTLVDRVHWAGRYEETWNGVDASGARVASGVYLLELRTDRVRDASRIVVVR